jgi:hypothetical protein
MSSTSSTAAPVVGAAAVSAPKRNTKWIFIVIGCVGAVILLWGVLAIALVGSGPKEPPTSAKNPLPM